MRKPENLQSLTVGKLHKILWELCKQIIRKKYIKKDGTWDCYTCGRLINESKKAQTGHFIPSGSCGAFLRHDLRNLRIQDYFCNINMGGAGAEYYKKMVEREGQDYVDQLFKDKQKTVKAKDLYITRIKEYREILKQYE